MTTLTEQQILQGLLARVAELERRVPVNRALKTMTLKVSLFAGTDVNDAAVELCQLADRVGALCEAEFNGVKLWARPGDNPLRLAEAFFVELERPANLFRVAQAR